MHDVDLRYNYWKDNFNYVQNVRSEVVSVKNKNETKYSYSVKFNVLA